MTQVQDRVTRVSADLFEAAAAEGARQSRSARQQLDHWARVGRAMCGAQSAATSRVAAALAGELPLTGLSDEERTLVNAEITARIEENLNESDYGSDLAAEGITTVALDDDGHLVEYRPDGTTVVLGAA